MATTIQVVEDLELSKFVSINGKRCEVESFSFSAAISQKNALEELVSVMAEELIENNVISKDDLGTYYWAETGEPLIPEQPYED